ncbi:hypothetical protein DM02DRAFT_631650 [Periconia macrospinosa]|uniref:Uncharacterized protein n=1 Tax=Periconia macrospinosa TaxID=97972 RepID=A0A2V1DFA6_9PLEO|nr:hypothetical protein DM02DRAFT_631650 [Periconia macrospinosa]
MTPFPTSLFLLSALVALTTAVPTNVYPHAANTTNGCPVNTEYACFDVINSSLCLGQKALNGTAEQLAACVDYPGGMSDLPGASKVCTLPIFFASAIGASSDGGLEVDCAGVLGAIQNL